MRRKLIEIQESESVTINGIALEKARRGEQIFNLSAGEPMVAAPAVVERAVVSAFNKGETHYPPPAGLRMLREAAAKWMNKDFKARYGADNTVVVNGGKFGIYLLLQALLNPGDEVLIISPYWVSYPSMVKIFNGVPRIVRTTPESGWKATAADIRRAVTKKSKLLIINNGSNPTGVLYTVNELKGILAAASKAGLFVISDEVYSGLAYDAPYVSAASFTTTREHLAVVQSASKNFAMTGLRVGFVFAPNDVARTLTGLMSQSTSGVTSVSQFGVLAALKDRKVITKRINREMRSRRNTFVQIFFKEFKHTVESPASALYTFVPLKNLGWGGTSSADFCRRAMEEANVALVPGSAFGAEGYVRFSFGADVATIKKGLTALAAWIRKVGKNRASSVRDRHARRGSVRGRRGGARASSARR